MDYILFLLEVVCQIIRFTNIYIVFDLQTATINKFTLVGLVDVNNCLGCYLDIVLSLSSKVLSFSTIWSEEVSRVLKSFLA